MHGLKGLVATVGMMAAALLTGCATSTQTASQPTDASTEAAQGQKGTRAVAAFFKSVAAIDAAANGEPASAASRGARVEVPFALWNAITNS